MTREILSAATRDKAIDRHNGRCAVCGYAVRLVLRVHHLVPVSLGGQDKPDNLIVLCGNCHTLVHLVGSGRIGSVAFRSLAESSLTPRAVARIERIAARLRGARDAIDRENGTVAGAIDLHGAIDSISRKNGMGEDQSRLLADAIHRTVGKIPTAIGRRCSHRLVGAGKYLSINRMNYLLFRTPAYGDFGQGPRYDSYLILPARTRQVAGLGDLKARTVFRFRHFDCINIGLSFEELLGLSAGGWSLFREACRLADRARPSRSWPSTVAIAERCRTCRCS